jgi:hypothetical protein
MSNMQRAYVAQAQALIEFGYPGVTAEQVERDHKAWLKGEKASNIIGMFNERAFEDYPDIFGTREQGE